MNITGKSKVDNAIIMAAGMSSRFAPLSYEKPKALLTVKGEVLIERQISQLQEAGISQIIVVVGYKKEQFQYLTDRFEVVLVENPEYLTRNNNSSIYAARKYLKNSYICSADNYFSKNPFENMVDESYYAAVFAEGQTKEWCMQEDEKGYISSVEVGGENAWYMLGHAFWSRAFSQKFLKILEREYLFEETKGKFWENIFIEHLRELPMKIRKYGQGMIYEFDSLDELREFDPIYKTCSNSRILEKIARKLGCREGELIQIEPQRQDGGEVTGIIFKSPLGEFEYNYDTERLEELKI